VSGYTPVFDSVFQGTLCGKYPDLPVWLVLLALQQRGGIIDAHPSYIATISGLPQADIETAIRRFCEPDPESRTPDSDGRRLEPLEGVGFGWRVINHRKYAEKARKMASDAQRAADGRNAERMAERNDADPRRPAQTRADPPSDSDANKKKKEGADAPVALVEGVDPKAWSDWLDYRKSIGKALKPASYAAAQRDMAKLGKGQAAAVEHSKAKGWTGLFAPSSPQNPPKKDPYANCAD
jgi:hypothetical protein